MNLHWRNLKFFLGQTIKRTIRGYKILKQHRRSIKYIYKKFGLKRALTFVWVKLFVKEAGPAILNPLFSVFPLLAPLPTHIEIEITTCCNLKCAICEQRYWQEKPRHMTEEEFKKIINEFPKLKWVGLAGIGSNFLHPQFIDFMKYLKKKNIYIEFVDHLYNVNEKELKDIIEMGVDRVTISMDAFKKETYESIKVGANYDKVVANIKKFVELKRALNSPLPEILFRFILTKKNINEAPLFLDFVASLGSIKDLGDGSIVEFAGLLYFDEISDYYLDEIPADISHLLKKKSQELNVPITFTHQHPKSRRPRFSCAAWVEPFIFVTGDVIPCCATNENNQRDFQRAQSFGNIFRQPMKEIWNSLQYRDFRKNVPKINGKVYPICKNCRVTQMSPN